MNNENLTPVRSKSEAREMGRRGGRASGKARRQKKTLRAVLRELLTLPADETPNQDFLTAIVLQAVRKAAKGDARARDFIFSALGGVRAEIEGDTGRRIVRAYLAGKMSLTQAGLAMETRGIPLPETFRALLAHAAEESPAPNAGTYCVMSEEELEQRAAERLAEQQAQRDGLPQRRAEMDGLHRQVADSHAPGAKPQKKEETDGTPR